MADYYEHATVHQQDLPTGLFAEDDLRILSESGFEWEEHGETYYFFVPERLSDDGGDDRTYHDVFQDVIDRSDGELNEITIEGAYTCSKMRPNGFGGFVIHITNTNIHFGSTTDVVSLMRSGTWPNTRHITEHHRN